MRTFRAAQGAATAEILVSNEWDIYVGQVRATRLPPGPICHGQGGASAPAPEVAGRRALAGARLCDQASVSDGLGEHRLLEQSVEEQSATP